MGSPASCVETRSTLNALSKAEILQKIVFPLSKQELLFLPFHLNMKDFEDAMQVAAAAAWRADVIATRNLRDCANAPVRAAKPESIVDEL